MPMNTIDSILPTISSNIKHIEHRLPKKDKKILVSFARQLASGNFLTENQAMLFIKILKENLNIIKMIVPSIDECVDANLWSKSFRIIKQFRKVYFSEEYPNYFVVEFNFNSRLKDKIQKILLSTNNCFVKGIKYHMPLTEETLFSVISAFKNDGFEVDEKILKFFHEIEKIKKSNDYSFDVFNLKNEKLVKSIERDIGSISKENLLLLNDRKFRYQYQIFEKNQKISLTEKIACRESKDVFLSTEEFSLDRIIESLKDLKRLPLLVVFDGHNSKKDKKTLEILNSAITSSNVQGDVGIYFRYNKSDDSENFNNEIQLLQYNKDLSINTVVAGISNSKLPKFMIDLAWRPEAVISFTNNFKSNKSTVYFNNVDLVIYYSSSKPLDEKIYEIL